MMSREGKIEIELERRFGNDNIEIDITQRNAYANVTVTTDRSPKTKDGTVLTGYIKITHILSSGFKISKITDSRNSINFDGFLNEVSTVSVFFWGTRLEKPLLVQLGDKDEYYITTDGNTWAKNQEENTNLQNALDKQNCEKNSLHVVNICKTGMSGNAYICPSCQQKQIQLTPDRSKNGRYNYVIYSHTSISSLGNVRNGNETIFPAPADVKIISVYWYNYYPLLLSYEVEENDIFKRRYYGDYDWVTENMFTKTIPVKPENIRKILEESSTPHVTLDVSHPIARLYKPAGNMLFFTVINALAEGSGFQGHKHVMTTTSLFTIKSLCYGTTKLNNITSNDKLTSVIAYYPINNTGLNSLLLVELERKSGNPKSLYFQQKDGFDENNWEKLQEGELSNENLIYKLEESSRKLPESPKQVVDGERKIEPKTSITFKEESDSQGNVININKKSTRSNNDPLGLAVGIVILCLVLLGFFRFVIRKAGPSIRTYLASRKDLLSAMKIL
ncbi:hypothetical protein BEWA_000740 [Theileria equi strain WA]|uniref:Uncharacterized protein n=1 Tax=Theileria equi strain WA TaxID=1537102 RepID=L0B0K5_THEEQ|nr:hypothetical protein BEWA_000740 [Theileria equi strain WA]AFZ80669.1 hypothetical protein BEWA_000740 [Theileria equi strain WA]|eukprot:XP_004830335.1 hypothetical protein BEWA_000740 [Theileria equi strain WA]